MTTIHAHDAENLLVLASLFAAAFMIGGTVMSSDRENMITTNSGMTTTNNGTSTGTGTYTSTGSGNGSGASTEVGTGTVLGTESGAGAGSGADSDTRTGKAVYQNLPKHACGAHGAAGFGRRIKGANLIFGDDFSSLSLHRTWQASDKWALISPSSPDGRGGPNLNEAGDMWWTNPYNPKTPINGLYSRNKGQLVLGLAAVPTAYQSYIDIQAGKHLPYAGTLINSAQTCYRLYGYWEVSAAVDNVAGFSFQACLESWEKTGKWPPEIDLRVTDRPGGAQEVMFQFYDRTIPGWRQWKSTSYNCTRMHSYGIEWQKDSLAFYVNRDQVWRAATPNDGSYSSYPCFWYLLTGANYENNGDPSPASLPCYARVDAVKVWDKRPW